MLDWVRLTAEIHFLIPLKRLTPVNCKMKTSAVLVLMASIAATAAGHSHYHHHHHRQHHVKAPVCGIERESQCNGQNWSMSTCCKDPSYECRWDDFGQNVMRCQKKKNLRKAHKQHEAEEDPTEDSTDAISGDSAESSGELASLQYAAPTRKHHHKGHGQRKGTVGMGFACAEDSDCANDRTCTIYRQMGQVCMPSTLPKGYLCGQSGPNYWKYDACASGLFCNPVGSGTDMRCV